MNEIYESTVHNNEQGVIGYSAAGQTDMYGMKSPAWASGQIHFVLQVKTGTPAICTLAIALEADFSEKQQRADIETTYIDFDSGMNEIRNAGQGKG